MCITVKGSILIFCLVLAATSLTSICSTAQESEQIDTRELWGEIKLEGPPPTKPETTIEHENLKSQWPIPSDIQRGTRSLDREGRDLLDYWGYYVTFGRENSFITTSTPYLEIWNDDRFLWIRLDTYGMDSTYDYYDHCALLIDVPSMGNHIPDEVLSAGSGCTYEDATDFTRWSGSYGTAFDFDNHYYYAWTGDDIYGGTQDGWGDWYYDWLTMKIPIGDAFSYGEGDVYDVNIRSGDVLGFHIIYYDYSTGYTWCYPAYDKDGGGYDRLYWEPWYWSWLWTWTVWGAHIPHIHDDSSWVTFLGVLNTATNPSNIRFDFYSDAGQWISGNYYSGVNSYGKVAGYAKNIAGLSSVAGNVHITSDRPFNYQCQIRDSGKNIWVNFAGKGMP